jgi:hypothetical protein
VPRVLDRDLLDRLDKLIEKYRLHSGGILQPVSMDRVLEAFTVEYRQMPPAVYAMTVRWVNYQREFVGITYNSKLKEPEASALKRHVSAHEYGHVVCSHKGDLFVMWRSEREPGGFDHWLDRVQERQCEHVAAYLLVPLKALEELAGMEKSHIARVLDVPEHLVELRWGIWRKWGR